MTRGNQRDLAREKNMKKQQQKAKGAKTESGASLQKKKERYPSPIDIYLSTLFKRLY
jgi:hypothetical protein